MHILCSWSSESSASKIPQNYFSLGYWKPTVWDFFSGHASALSCRPYKPNLTEGKFLEQVRKADANTWLQHKRTKDQVIYRSFINKKKSLWRFSRSIDGDDAPKWRRNSQWAEKVSENCKTKNKQTRRYPHRERCHKPLRFFPHMGNEFPRKP